MMSVVFILRIFCHTGAFIFMEYTISLKQNTCFKRLYYKGKYKAGGLVVVYLMKRKGNFARLGITVGKKVGKAVQRNRVRRMILAAYRELEHSLCLKGFDIVIVARPPALSKKSTDIQRELGRLIPLAMKLCGKSR